ncbi:MAG TPA: phosphatidylserine/phosphatidylglycerophosphate/cardiolipin synthase family protein, partial [Stenomitos sp.]
MTTIGSVPASRPATAAPLSARTTAPTAAARMASDSVQFSQPAQPWRLSTGNHIAPLVDREQVMAAVMDTIRGAQRTLQLSSYLFGGEVSQEIAEALVKRKKAGVNVQVLLDPKLSQVGQDDDGKAIAYLKANGIDVRTYPVKKINEGESRWRQGNAIDHAKVLVADGKLALAGGMNLSDKGVEAHDFMVRIEGMGASQLGETFDEDWALSGGKLAEKSGFQPPTAPGDGSVTISENSPSRHNLAPLVLSEIGQAKRSIAVEALFLDHPDYLQALIDAHQRGIDVQ